MPATITRLPADVERKDPGVGGRPPVDHRPTGGGGDGENWDNRRPGGHGPRELLVRYRMGLGFALAGDLMFFIMLVSAFFVQQHTGHINPDNEYILDWQPLAIPPILWINTAVLLLSCLTIETARRYLFRERYVMEEWFGLGKPTSKRALPWMLATAVLGSLFLWGQWTAWTQLASEGVYFASNPSSHFFYLITGAHAIHLLFGVFAIAAALGALWLAKSMEMRQIIVDCAAWYWHVMGIFWAFLFFLLVFGQSA